MGAIQLAGTWRSTAPPDDVWGVVVDLSSWSSWWPAIDDVELQAGVPHAPEAARLTFGTPAPLRPLHVRLEVRELAAPHRLVVAAVDSPIVGDGELEVVADEGGSATRFDLTLRVRSLLFRPVERLLANAAHGSGRDRLRQAGDDLARLAGGDPRPHDL